MDGLTFVNHLPDNLGRVGTWSNAPWSLSGFSVCLLQTTEVVVGVKARSEDGV